MRVAVPSILAAALLCVNAVAATAASPPATDVDARGPDGSTALMWAAHRGDATEVERLIEAGADVCLANRYGATAMMEAATTADVPILKLLLEAGADADSPNPEGQTALMAVARTGNVEAARLLLEHRARVNAKESWGGQTALMWAAAQSQPDMVKLLVKHGADVEARAVVRDWQRKVTAEGRPKDMNRGGFSTLLYAAREGCVECAKHLIAGRADIDGTDPENTTPLLLALTNLRWDFAKYLIGAGADIDAWDFWGQTPLYVAIDMHAPMRTGRIDLPAVDATTGYEIVELLVKSGANVNAQLKLRPPFRHAIFDRTGNPIFTTGATPLMRAARVADLQVMKLLLANGARVALPNINGVTPLLAAAGSGRGPVTVNGRIVTEQDALGAVKLLKESGADVNVVPTGLAGRETALHSAALRGWDDMVKLLVGYGANLDAQAANANLTPLDYALARYQPGFLETKPRPLESTAALLRELGAKLEHPNLPPWPGVPTPTITAAVPE